MRILWGFYILLFISSVCYAVAQADFRLDVWNIDDGIGEAQAIATKRFVAHSDCRKERAWLISLTNILIVQLPTKALKVWVTCVPMGVSR